MIEFGIHEHVRRDKTVHESHLHRAVAEAGTMDLALHMAVRMADPVVADYSPEDPGRMGQADNLAAEANCSRTKLAHRLRDCMPDIARRRADTEPVLRPDESAVGDTFVGHMAEA